MTQTIPTPQAAMTITRNVSGYRTVKLHFFPLESVEAAREEFGDGWEAARNFVLGVTCTECGAENGELECHDCGEGGCYCTMAEDWHDGEIRCADCQHPCGCRECTD